MEALVSKAEEGDTRALDIVLDRLEGKVQSQTVIILDLHLGQDFITPV